MFGGTGCDVIADGRCVEFTNFAEPPATSFPGRYDRMADCDGRGMTPRMPEPNSRQFRETTFFGSIATLVKHNLGERQANKCNESFGWRMGKKKQAQKKGCRASGKSAAEPSKVNAPEKRTSTSRSNSVSSNTKPIVVGVGASEGGLEAIQELLRALETGKRDCRDKLANTHTSSASSATRSWRSTPVENKINDEKTMIQIESCSVMIERVSKRRDYPKR